MTTARKKKSGPPVPAPIASEPDHTVEWDEVAAAVLAVKGITSGWWRVGVKLRFAALTGRMGDADGLRVMPTALVGVESMALFATTAGGDMVFDAATGKQVPAGSAANFGAGSDVRVPKPARAARSRK